MTYEQWMELTSRHSRTVYNKYKAGVLSEFRTDIKSPRALVHATDLWGNKIVICECRTHTEANMIAVKLRLLQP